jgi:hypothetical protein
VQHPEAGPVPVQPEDRPGICAAAVGARAIQNALAALEQPDRPGAIDATGAETVQQSKAAPVPVQLEDGAEAQIAAEIGRAIQRAVAAFNQAIQEIAIWVFT